MPVSAMGANARLAAKAVIDWVSRGDLSWRLSNPMDVSFRVAALEETLARHDKPEIFNTDQGSRFTSADFTGVLIEAGIRMSINRRGQWKGQHLH